MTKFPRPVIAGSVLLALLLAAVLATRFALDSYLKGDAFRQRLDAAVGGVLKADGTFNPLERTGAILYSEQFVARGSSGAFFSELRADQIRADFNWRSLLRRTVRIDELTVQKLEIQFAELSRTITKGEALTPEPRPARKGAAWDVDLHRATIAESFWRWRTNSGQEGSITGSAFTLTPSGDSWLIDANGGKVSQQGWPDLSIEFAKLRYTGSSLFVTESLLRDAAGKIAVTGEVAFQRAADLQAQFNSIPLTPFLPNDWRARLAGNFSGTTKIHAPFSGEPIHAEGNLRLTNGQIEALPFLDALAKFTRTDRFRRVTITKGALVFTRGEKLIAAKDIVIESEGLMRIEGACTIVNGEVDGLFQIGVTAASLQWLPGSQSRVFTIAHDGYYWTPLRLTGPVEHPTEDLSPRLIAAAADEMLENAQDTLLDAAKSVLDLLPR